MKPERSSFSKALVQANSLDLVRWDYEAGMRHGDTLKWWDKTPRGGIHNGIDLVQYVDGSGTVRSLTPGMKVPLMYEGEFLKAMNDFLGRSVIFGHETENGLRLISVYGHVDPLPGLQGIMAEESIIAVISDTKGKTVPPHLHLSLFLVPEEITADELDWGYLGNSPDIRCLDPLEYI